ncbi:SDR family oxidoreductase [Williamsia sp. SKLECPSW1]
MPRTIDITVPDLTGRRAVVTGGSDGIGLRIARRLAQAGAEVVLPVRNSTKGRAAVDAIRAGQPDAAVSLRIMDLSSLASVAELTAGLRDEGKPIHMLVNNAGLMTPPERQVTDDGAEVQFATNHLGHVALVAGLLPLLQAGRARVVSQISVAANRGSINWDDLAWEKDYDGMGAYSQSKIALGLFGIELGRRSERFGWGVTSVLAHPGVAPTSLLAARPEVGRADDTRSVRLIRWLSARGLVVGTAETAALPAVLAATTPDAVDGTLYGPKGIGHLGGAPAPQSLYSRLRSSDEATRVWETSERLAGVTFPTAGIG